MMNLEGARRAAPGPAEVPAAPSPPPDPTASTLPGDPCRETCWLQGFAAGSSASPGTGISVPSPLTAPAPYLTTWKAAEIMSSLWSAMPM